MNYTDKLMKTTLELITVDELEEVRAWLRSRQLDDLYFYEQCEPHPLVRSSIKEEIARREITYDIETTVLAMTPEEPLTLASSL